MSPITHRSAPMAALLLASCGLAPNVYSGDGRLSDAGVFAAHDRYILDLGLIDLSRDGAYRFEIARLPDETFVLGFDITATARRAESIADRKPVDAQVSLQVTNERDERVISVAQPLYSWTWSGIGRSEMTPDNAFVYSRGKVNFTPRGQVSPKRPPAVKGRIQAGDPTLGQDRMGATSFASPSGRMNPTRQPLSRDFKQGEAAGSDDA